MGHLHTVAAARGLAALAVVFFHANASVRYMGGEAIDLLSIGERGVDFFFVLSGFIIFHVHSQHIGKPEMASGYALKRFIRLFPLWWLVAGAWIVLKTLIGEGPTLQGAATSLLLVPSLTDPMPLVVWTLRHEMLFYLAFLVLIINRWVGTSLFAVWLLAVVFQMALSIEDIPITGIASFFLSSYAIDFMLGAGVAILHAHWRFQPSFVFLWTGLILLLLLLTLEHSLDIQRTGISDYTTVAATLWTPIVGIAFAIILHGMLCVEKVVKVHPVLLGLGASSYALYLVHTPLQTVTQRIAVVLPVGLSHLLIVAASLAGAWYLHTLAEKPIGQRLRSLTRP